MHRNESSTGWRTWAAVIALAGFIAWLLACVLNAGRDGVADDAFITFTYARNLAEGFGLRYNATDAAPTSGASSLLHAFFAAAAIRAGADPLIATRALSLAAFVLLGAAFGASAARAVRIPIGVGCLAGLATCGVWGLMSESVTHLTSGMETMLFTLAHGLVACWALLAATQHKRWLAWAGLAPLTMLLMTRPEGGMLALAYVAVVALARGDDLGFVGALRGQAALFVAVLAAIVALAVWHVSYFGHLYPNAYHVKVDNAIFGSSGAWLPGVDTTARFVFARWLPLAGIVAALAVVVHTPRSVVRRALWLLAPSTLVALGYSRAIHEMAAGLRYEFPMLAPLWLALVVGLCALYERAPKRFYATLWLGALGAPLLAGPVSPPAFIWLQHPRSVATTWLSETPKSNALARLGLDLAETGLGQDASILLSGAGQVPYYSRWRAIDWIGLNHNEFSGRDALTIEELWREIDALAPDACFSILPPASPGALSPQDDPNWNCANVQRTLGGRGSALFEHWNATRLRESFWREMKWIRDHCEFAGAYKLGQAWGDDWWVLVYVRRDSSHRERVLETLSRSARVDRESDLGATFPFDPRRLGQAP